MIFSGNLLDRYQMQKKKSSGNSAIGTKENYGRPGPDYEKMSLETLCSIVKEYKAAFEDVSELIEDKAYMECESGGVEKTLEKLKGLATFFELLENKNEENCRDLADVYLLIGEIYQYNSLLMESVQWLSKAVVVDDRYPVPYHNLAISYMKMGKAELAIKSLEQEIAVAPGNYYSYLLLADLHEKEGRVTDLENTLKRLLARDPDNIQALHRLIRLYEKTDIGVDIRLLKKRLLSISRQGNRLETTIRVYYLCRDGRFSDALNWLSEWHLQTSEVATLHLLRGYIFGEMKQYEKKDLELAAFKAVCNGRNEVVKSALEEFGNIFGYNISEKLFTGSLIK